MISSFLIKDLGIAKISVAKLNIGEIIVAKISAASTQKNKIIFKKE